MADASEDHLLALPAGQSSAGEVPDLEEEVQDFRFLNKKKIPSRGVKDFEPVGTKLQASILETSRDAMREALSEERVHNPGKERAVYDPERNGAWLVKEGGIWLKTVGRSRRMEHGLRKEKGKPTPTKTYLLPEEALWLVERGSLDVRWPAEEGEDEDKGLPMSLQGAYAAFIGMEGEGGLTLEKYMVYSYMKRAGYTVLRAADNWENVPKYLLHALENSSVCSFWQQIWKSVFGSISNKIGPRSNNGPLVRPGLYKSYDDIYRLLEIIPTQDPSERQKVLDQTPADSAELKVHFHIYKSTPNFKKTQPGPPDFYFSVLNAREESLLTEAQIDSLFQQTPHHPPLKDASVYAKIKNGWKNVILAVVDQGVISFLDISDANFGQAKLWARPKKQPAVGSKRRVAPKAKGRSTVK